MNCQVCGECPRMFMMFDGSYWKTLFTDYWICPVCWYWATAILRGQR